jgi:hypothetical protein
MASSITTGIAAFLLIAGVWAANLVCYSPQSGGLDPTSPVALTMIVQ